MTSELARYHYDFMMKELANNKTLSEEDRSNYIKLTRTIRNFFNF